MRRNLLIILMLVLAVSLTACGPKADNSSTTAPETEDVDLVEEDVAEDADEVEEAEETDETEEVAEADESDTDSEDELTWPSDFLPSVPEFQGKIFKFTEKQDDVHIYIGFEDVTYEEAVSYVEELKEAGFTKDSNGYTSEGTVNYKGDDKDGNFVKFHWSQNGYGGVDIRKK